MAEFPFLLCLVPFLLILAIGLYCDWLVRRSKALIYRVVAGKPELRSSNPGVQREPLSSSQPVRKDGMFHGIETPPPSKKQ